jgi:ligand-binding sensor domain-containing protein
MFGAELSLAEGCQATARLRFTNFGLLAARQIDAGVEIVDLGYAPPAGERRLSGCTTAQPLGAEGWIWDIAIGPAGEVWVAGNSGVARRAPGETSWTAYREAEGLPAGSMRSLAVTPGGELWATSWEGELAHFDGQSWGPPPLAGLPDGEITVAVVAPDGSLWLGSGEGAWRWDGAAWQRFGEAEGVAGGSVRDILFTPDGTTWLAHYGAVSYRPPGADRWTVYPAEGGAQMDGYDTAAVAPDGKIWFSGQRAFDPASGEWQEGAYRREGQWFAYDLALEASGGLWLARGDDSGLIFIPDPSSSPHEQWQNYTAEDGLGGDDVRSLALEGETAIWTGAENGQVSRCELAPAAP